MSKMDKIEYKVVKFPMPSDFQIVDENNNTEWDKQWEELEKKHQKLLNTLGFDRWEFYDRMGSLFYFKREDKL